MSFLHLFSSILIFFNKVLLLSERNFCASFVKSVPKYFIPFMLLWITMLSKLTLNCFIVRYKKITLSCGIDLAGNLMNMFTSFSLLPDSSVCSLHKMKSSLSLRIQISFLRNIPCSWDGQLILCSSRFTLEAGAMVQW